MKDPWPPPQMYGKSAISLPARITRFTASGALRGGVAVPSAFRRARDPATPPDCCSMCSSRRTSASDGMPGLGADVVEAVLGARAGAFLTDDRACAWACPISESMTPADAVAPAGAVLEPLAPSA